MFPIFLSYDNNVEYPPSILISCYVSIVKAHFIEWLGFINPYCTRQGQSWPCQTLPSNSGQKFLCRIKTNLFLQNSFWIFLSFWHDVKQWCFDIHFDVFSSEVLSRCHPADPPPFAQFYFYYRLPEPGRSSAGLWSATWSGASLYSNQFLVMGCAECRGWRVLSQVRSLALT
jgi:hypothetical protein